MAHNIAITGMLLSVYRLSTASYSDARMQKKSIGKSFSNPIIVVYWPAVLRTYNSCIGWRLWRESGMKLKLVSSSAVCTSVPRRRDPPVFEPWGSRSSLLSIIVITDRAYPVAAAHVWYELLRHVTSPPSLRVASRLTFFWPSFLTFSDAGEVACLIIELCCFSYDWVAGVRFQIFLFHLFRVMSVSGPIHGFR